MNLNRYHSECRPLNEPFTPEDLYEEFWPEYEHHPDKIPFDTFKTYRFIWLNNDDSLYKGKIEVVYALNNVYYLVIDDHDSFNDVYKWDPEEVSKEFLLRQFPDIDLNADLFKS